MCYWTQDDDGIWHTGCGNMSMMIYTAPYGDETCVGMIGYMIKTLGKKTAEGMEL